MYPCDHDVSTDIVVVVVVIDDDDVLSCHRLQTQTHSVITEHYIHHSYDAADDVTNDDDIDHHQLIDASQSQPAWQT